VAEVPETTRQRFLEIERLIAAEQRHLRSVIRDLRPSVSDAARASLATRLAILEQRLEFEWGVDIDLRWENLGEPIRKDVSHDIYYIVSEALGNAAKHAGASSVRAEVRLRDEHVEITVADDGRGFPFRGRYDHGALERQQLGPVTLKERITARGGTLAIESSEGGARLEIALPLVPAGSGHAR
jgi:signal transduction histidine kinase